MKKNENVEIFKQSREYAQSQQQTKTIELTQDEKDLEAYVTREFTYADSAKSDIEEQWENEYKMYKGGGLQWKTTLAYRSDKAKKYKPNSEDNFIFPAIENIVSNLTQNTPEATLEIQGASMRQEQPEQEGQPEQQQEPLSKRLSDMLKFNDNRNNFRSLWRKIIKSFVSYGPMIISVLWDEDWIGGTGPNRWLGDIRIINVKKEEFYPDPSIVDLETDLQKCRYIIRRFAEQVEDIRLKWPETGYNVKSDMLDGYGTGCNSVYLIEFWHRGYPFFMPEKRVEELKQEIEDLQSIEGMEWRIKDLESMIKGELDGIHLAYVANDTFLEYIPYAYNHGKYPFIFKCRYADDNSQWPWGEIRNIMIPQLLHNKADEIEIDAMCRTGLGGDYVRKGAMSKTQMDNYKKNSAKPGAVIEVDDPNGIIPRTPTVVPANITNYKNAKQSHISDISVSQIQMGKQPVSGMAYRTIQELGNRADAKTQSVGDILEDGLIEMNKLRIALMAQFYTEDRYYRVKGKDGNVSEGSINNKELYLSWDRISIDEETGEQRIVKELFEAEFDINVKIIDEKPTDRGYYTQTAMQLYSMQLISIGDLWATLEDGKFPPKEVILQNLQAQQQQQAQMQQAKMQEEAQSKQQEMSIKQQEMEMKQTEMLLKHKASLGKGNNKKEDGEEKKNPDEFIQMIQENFPEIWDYISRLPEQQQSEIIDMLMNLNPQELEDALVKLQQSIPLLQGGETSEETERTNT